MNNDKQKNVTALSIYKHFNIMKGPITRGKPDKTQ